MKLRTELKRQGTIQPGLTAICTVIAAMSLLPASVAAQRTGDDKPGQTKEANPAPRRDSRAQGEQAHARREEVRATREPSRPLPQAPAPPIRNVTPARPTYTNPPVSVQRPDVGTRNTQ